MTSRLLQRQFFLSEKRNSERIFFSEFLSEKQMIKPYLIACIDFFVENSIEYVKVELEEENMTSFESLDGTLRIVCGDYFKLTSNLLPGKFHCIWDRGSLVAIPKEKRREYA